MIQERGNPTLHFLDRYAGIPAITLLGFLRRKRPLPPKIDIIGLFKTGAIGDTVLMSGVIADLRQTFPRATLIFFAGRGNLEAARMIDGVDRVVEVPVKNLLAGLKAVRSISVDVMVDFGQWSRLEAFLTFFSRAACTIGFQTPGQHRESGYDVTVAHSAQMHELENFRRLTWPLGVETGHAPRLRIPQAAQRPDSDYVVFHLWPGGVRSHLKEWRAVNWLRLIEDFVHWGMEVVLTGGPADRERNEKLIASVNSCSRERVRNSAGVSLKETCCILARARLVVSVNTGVMHLAAALGAPLVALHGPTSSKRWGPVSSGAVVVASPHPESGYLNLGWEYPIRPPACMDCIQYKAVRDACHSIMMASPHTSRHGSSDVASEGTNDEI